MHLRWRSRPRSDPAVAGDAAAAANGRCPAKNGQTTLTSRVAESQHR